MELKQDEIIKASECCASEITIEFNCTECPYIGRGCNIAVMRDALALIKELTEERTDHLSLIDAKDVIINDLNEKHNRLLEENERLRAKYEITYETPSGKMTMPNLLSLDGKAAELHAQMEHKVKADTVTEVVAGIMGIIEFDIALTDDETEYLKRRIDEYANEMLEDSK